MNITMENRAMLRQIMLSSLRTSLRTTDESIERSLSLIILGLIGDLDVLEKQMKSTGQDAPVFEDGPESGLERNFARHIQNELIEYIAIARNNHAASVFLRNLSFLERECRGVVDQMERVRLRLSENADGLTMPDGGGDFARNLTFFIHDFRELSEAMDRLKRVLQQFCQSLTMPDHEQSGCTQ